MSSTRDPLAAFDDDVFGAVADETDLEESDLRDAVCRHQEAVRDLPGVDNIVYEWRNQFHLDPLLDRSESAYVLALQDHVWGEFTDDMELSEGLRDALLAVHDHQARRTVSDTDRLDSDAALVLTRP